MLQRSERRIIVEPEEVVVEEVTAGLCHIEIVRLFNAMSVGVDVRLRAGPTVDRSYEIFPSELHIAGECWGEVEIRVRLLSVPRAGWTIRDVINIETDFSSEVFYVSMRPPALTSEEDRLQAHLSEQLASKELELRETQTKVRRLEEENEDLTHELRMAQSTLEDKARVEQELARVQQENTELHAELVEIKKTENYFEQVKQLFRDKVPRLEDLIDITLKQEQEKNERKSEKVMEILQIKDSLIEDLEGRIEEQTQTIVSLQNKLNDAKVLLNNQEDSLKESASNIEDAKALAFQKEQLARKLQSDLDHFRQTTSGREIERLREELEIQKYENQEFKTHAEEAWKTVRMAESEAKSLRDREVYVLEMCERQKEQEQLLVEKEQAITELKTKVNTQSEHIEGLLGKFSQNSSNEVISKVIQLEEENKHLQKQLSESQRSFKKEELEFSDDKFGKIQKLEEENLKLCESKSSIEIELFNKNKEVIELQQQMIELQRLRAAPSPDEEVTKLCSSLKESEIKVRQISEKNDELSIIVQSLEKSNKDIMEDVGTLIHNIENPTQTEKKITSQVVKRLNSRITALQTREEKAIEAAHKAEEIIHKLKNQMEEERISWQSERSSLRQSRDNRSNRGSQTEEEDWLTFEKQRLEKRISEFNKEAALYQMKHYEALKDNHEIKEKFELKASQHIEEVGKLKREIIHLRNKCEALEENYKETAAARRSLQISFDDLKSSNDSNERTLEDLRVTSSQERRKHEEEVSKLQLKLDQKEISIQERTSQLAVLMESMESSHDLDSKLADFTAQLCNAKASECNLKREIDDLNLQVSMLHNSNLEKSKMMHLLNEKLATYNPEKLRQQIDNLTTTNTELKEKLAIGRHDIQTLQLQLARSVEEEKALKEKISFYVQQLQHSQKRHAEVLSKERHSFQESLLKIRQERMNSDHDYERPLVLAINQLSVALASKNVQDPRVFGKITKQVQEVLLESDSVMLKSEAKIRDLEFQLQSEIYYKYIDADSIESADRLLDLVEILSAEITTLRSLSQSSKADLYASKLSHLENQTKENALLIENLENENIELKKQIEVATYKSQCLGDALLAEEANKLHSFVSSSAESIARSSLQMRDEEIKTYLENVLAKLNSTHENSKLVALGRELGDIKIENKELLSQIQSLKSEKKALEITNNSLTSIIKDSETRELSFSIKTRPRIDTNEEKQSEVLRLKEHLITAHQENEQLQQKLSDFRREIHHLKGSKHSQGGDDSALKVQIAELKESHRIEIENLRTALLLENSSYQQRLEQEYEERCSKFNDGEFPGDFKLKNAQLSKDIQGLNNKILKVNEENANLRSKIEQGFIHNSRLKDENESLKNIIAGLDSLNEPKSSDRSTKKTVKKIDRNLGPQKLVKALVNAKLGESEALRKSKSLVRQIKETKDTLFRSEDNNRKLEAFIKNLKQFIRTSNLPEPSEDYAVENSTEASLLKKIKALENEISQLRFEEVSAWTQFEPFSWINFEEEPCKDEDFGTLVEAVVFLAEEMAEIDRKAPASIEKSQRLVIRNLVRQGPVSHFKPSSEEDRQLWYVELLETQLSNVHDTVRNLVNYMNEISVEITGNLNSSAQYKGASIELAKATKDTSEQVEILKQTALLIKGDLQSLRKGKDPAKDRAIITENKLKKTEESAVKMRKEYERQIQELKALLESYQSESNVASENYDNLKFAYQKLQDELNLIENSDEVKRKLIEENNSLRRKLKTLAEDTQYHVENFKRESEGYQKTIKDLENKKHSERSFSSGRRSADLAEHSHSIEIISQKNQYEKNIAELNEELKYYKDKLACVEDEIRAKADSQIAELESKIKDICKEAEERTQRQVAGLKFENDKLVKELQSLSDEKENLTGKLIDKSAYEEKAKAKLNEIEREKENLEFQHSQEITELRNTIQDLNKQLKRSKNLQVQLESADSDKEILAKQVIELQDSFEKSKSQVSSLTKEKKRLNSTIKELENAMSVLESEKELLEASAQERIENLRQELKQTYTEFERTIEKYEGQCSSLKELMLNEAKAKKVKREAIDYMFQISKKDGLIRSLKSELKNQKPKKKVKTEGNIEDITSLENQLYKQRALNKQLESRLNITREELEKSRSETPAEEPKSSKKEIAEIEKRHKQEMTRLAEEVSRIREKWHSPEDWNALLSSHTDLETALKKANDELNRKRELLENYKARKDHQESETNALQDEIENIREMADRLKRLKMEVTRKDKTINDLKLNLEQTRENERKLNEELSSSNDKIKSLKNDAVRKDTMVKELKTRLESFSSLADNERNKTEALEKCKEQLRKLKNDSERKEAQVKTIKAKLDSKQTELESLRQEHEQSGSDAFNSLEKEIKKSERLQVQLNRSEKQLQALYQITRRIFRDLSDSVEHLRSRFGNSELLDKEYFSECMDILNLDLDELSEFMAHGDYSASNALQFVERMLENQDIDSSQVLQVFRKLMDERVELEKSGGDVARKYEDYINRMKQEVSKQRKQYELKISQLEKKISH